MRWQDIKIAKKLGIGFGFVIFLMLTISLVSQLGLKQLSSAIDGNVYFNALQNNMLKREIDHMNWQNKVIIFLLSDTSEPLKVTMDDRACKLGKWLYGEERDKAGKMLPQLATLFSNLEEPHRNLHLSAQEIQRSVTGNDGDRDEAMEIYNTTSRKALQQVKAGLHDIAELVEQHVHENSQEIQATSSSKGRLIIGLSIISLVLALLFSFFLARRISSTLNQAVAMADNLAQGDLTSKLDLQQEDELGKLATALNSMAKQLNTLIGTISGDVIGLASTSHELNSIALSMGESSTTVSKRATAVATSTHDLSSNMQSVAAASEQASTNVSIVASASEEVASSIGEMDAKTREARAITEDAVALAASSTEKVDALGEAASKINKVTQVITEISEQTNLLALNATIEAARAGEAGKGFAVVANEIKELAKQTADATDEIRSSIEAMQSSTNETVDEIRQISDVITQVDEIVATIAVAVAEQSSTTSEITENINQAAQGIGEVNENVAQSSMASADISDSIDQVSDMTDELSTTSSDVEQSATELSQTVSGIKKMIENFKIDSTGIESNSQSKARDLMRWNNSLKLNIKEIDSQHHKLVDMINDLHRAMKERSSASKAGAILDRLVDYTASHFAHEERLFDKLNYPDTAAHKQLHKKLVAQVVDFQKQFKAGDATLSMELMDFLQDWLVNHIKGTDKKYVSFFKEQGIR